MTTVLRLALAAALLAGCSGAPGAVPTPTASFVAPRQTAPADATTPAACQASSADRATVATCQLPYAEALLAQAYAPVVTSRGVDFEPPRIVLADGPVDTTCGQLTRTTYCPGDRTLVLDERRLATLGDRAAGQVEWDPSTLAYFSGDLTAQQMAAGGSFGTVMALAHEYAHHVQTLLGYEALNATQMADEPERKAELSSEFELMADCMSGWTAAIGNASGTWFVEPVDQWAAVTALAEIGDDFRSRPGATPASSSSFNHGGANERANIWVTGVSLGLAGSEPFDGCLAAARSVIADRQAG